MSAKRNSLSKIKVKTDVADYIPKKNLSTRKSLRIGTLVWSKLDKWPWWPAVIIPNDACGLPAPKPNHFWVFWFGTHQASQMKAENMICFLDDNFESLSQFGRTSDNTKLDKGMAEALRAFAEVENQFKITKQEQLQIWALKLFKKKKNENVVLEVFPDWLVKFFIKMKDANSNLTPISKEKKEINLRKKIDPKNNKVKNKKNTGDDEEIEIFAPRDCDLAMIDRIKEGSLELEHFCLICHNEIMGNVQEHPLFVGGICNGTSCKKELIQTSYAIGEDNIHIACAICGSTGKCAICDNKGCSRVYCQYCIELLVGEGSFATLLDLTPWLCFLCTKTSSEVCGLIQARDGWDNRLQQFLHPDLISRLSGYVPKRNKPSTQLRIVVLHDNLGSVNYALKALGLEVDKYMLWDQWNDVRDLNDEIQVVVLDHADRMNETQWAQLSPVHLLISCVPLIVGNSATKLSGRQVGRRVFSEGNAGEAFFIFRRIKSCIELHNGSTKLLWAVESVNVYHLLFSRFLEMEPIIFDIKDAQGRERIRLVWTNIPQSDFTPPVETSKEELIASYDGPLLSDSFFIKYPWVLHDILAINQPAPVLTSFQTNSDVSCCSVRETRSKSNGVPLRPPSYLQHYTVPDDTPKPNKSHKMKRDVKQETWKVHELDSDVVELQGDSIDNINYALKLGFPQDFASFVCRLDPIEVQVRLITSLPVSLWMRILTPLVKLIKADSPSAAGKRKRK